MQKYIYLVNNTNFNLDFVYYFDSFSVCPNMKRSTNVVLKRQHKRAKAKDRAILAKPRNVEQRLENKFNCNLRTEVITECLHSLEPLDVHSGLADPEAFIDYMMCHHTQSCTDFLQSKLYGVRSLLLEYQEEFLVRGSYHSNAFKFFGTDYEKIKTLFPNHFAAAVKKITRKKETKKNRDMYFPRLAQQYVDRQLPVIVHYLHIDRGLPRKETQQTIFTKVNQTFATLAGQDLRFRYKKKCLFHVKQYLRDKENWYVRTIARNGYVSAVSLTVHEIAVFDLVMEKLHINLIASIICKMLTFSGASLST